MMYESIIDFTYYNLYGGMMRGNYYYTSLCLFPLNHYYRRRVYRYYVPAVLNNIIWIKTALCTHYYILCWVKMNLIQSNEYSYFWFDFS